MPAEITVSFDTDLPAETKELVLVELKKLEQQASDADWIYLQKPGVVSLFWTVGAMWDFFSAVSTIQITLIYVSEVASISLDHVVAVKAERA